MSPSVNNGSVTLTPGFTVSRTDTVTPESFSMMMVGGGIRYSPTGSVMFDVGYARLPRNIEYAQRTQVYHTPLVVNPAPSAQRVKSGSTNYVQGTVNWTHPLGWGLRGIAGGGFAYNSISAENAAFRGSLVPELRAELEYRWGRHLGIGVMVNYDLLSTGGSDSGFPNDQTIRLERLSFSPSAAMYF